MFVGGGDMPEVTTIGVGLLGADYKIENGRYRFARIYNGENWNPRFSAPLTEPGVNVKEGDYLLAVNGREVARPRTSTALRGTADQQTLIKVGPNPDGKGAREVTVVPVASDTGLRNRAWIDDNRRKVDALRREAGLCLSARHRRRRASRISTATTSPRSTSRPPSSTSASTGGLVADYIIDYLRRPLMCCCATREGADSPPRSLDLRAEGDDHQRVCRLGRRRAAVDVPQDEDRAARRQADVGRPGGHRRLC